VTEEHLHVGKRSVSQGGVRVHSRVTERPVEKQVNLREEHVHVERRPVDRNLRPGERAFEERSVEARETSERPVVSKEARVTEEVNLRKDATERTESVRDTVRKTDVDVEKLSGERRGTSGGSGGRDFDPARFVGDINRDKRYAGRDWSSAESDYRKSFEPRYPNGNWNEVKDRVKAEHMRSAARM
jgi:uncharacterized protein (TIGR02271 family)